MTPARSNYHCSVSSALYLYTNKKSSAQNFIKSCKGTFNSCTCSAAILKAQQTLLLGNRSHDVPLTCGMCPVVLRGWSVWRGSRRPSPSACPPTAELSPCSTPPYTGCCTHDTVPPPSTYSSPLPLPPSGCSGSVHSLWLSPPAGPVWRRRKTSRCSAYIFPALETSRLTFLRMRDKCKIINVQRKDKAFMV